MRDSLIAIDVAVLPPPHVAARACALSAALAPPADAHDPLVLGGAHLPHITLTQQFVRREELDAALARVDAVLAGHPPLHLTVTGGGKGSSSVWMAIDNAPELTGLHARLMEELRGLERPDGGADAFFGGDARTRDVLWVAGYRLKSSFGHYQPHITLGHAEAPPAIERIAFTATTVAACHLGRYCSCRAVLRQWTLA